MKIMMTVAALLGFAVPSFAQEWGGKIRWENSLDAALTRAKREGKPILFHQLVGDLDKEGC
jgi:hypothetical protein